MIPSLSMELAKLTLVNVERPDAEPVVVLFNPSEMTLNTTGWHSGADGLIPAKDPKTLSLSLFFDTSLPQTAGGGVAATVARATLGRVPGLPKPHQPEDVRLYTRPVVQLTEPQIDWSQGKRPPICRLQWGKGSGKTLKDGFFQGVLESVSQRFSRFLADGTPIRATLACKFTEWEDPDHQGRALNIIDDPVHIVKRGETLSTIAHQEYGDPALWRLIAEENRLTNPRHLVPGQRLTVPPRRAS
jgi:nucleoid-associated protein YgaU